MTAPACVASPLPRTADPRRRATRLAITWLPFGALAVAAAMVGGVPGLLLVFLGALVALDRILDRLLDHSGLGGVDAEHAFARLARERRRESVARRLRGRPVEPLAYLADDTGWAAVARHRSVGVTPVAVASIVGSTDRHKTVAFDHCFRPPAYSRIRWTLMYRAARRGVELPPVSLYRVGDEHFVRDGHHRVSVARAMGAAEIDAEVVELIRRSRARQMA